ncbi:MAG: hypothetical protein J6Y56_07555 [Fibrobacterales bacterium]|nr:hypothetical protein [Fibrobacterales bacterium]
MTKRQEEAKQKARRLRRKIDHLEMTERVEMLGALEEAYWRLAPYYFDPDKSTEDGTEGL